MKKLSILTASIAAGLCTFAASAAEKAHGIVFGYAAEQGVVLGANVLTSLAADIYKAADVVGRELVGIIPSCTINGDGTERVAKGGVVRSHFTRTPSVNTSFAPSMTIPEGTDQTVDNKTMTLNNFASVQIPWTGEDMKHVNNGSGFETVYGDQIAQAMRAIVNTIEAYMGVLVKNGAARAFGTAGTTPFGSNFNEVAEIRQILVDNGCPMDDGQSTLVLSTTAGTKLRNLAQLQKANEAGGDSLLRRGTLLDLQGLMLKESAGIATHTKGTGASYLVNNASGYAVGSTSIALDTGSGTIVAGDIFTNTTASRDANKYVVGTALTGGSVVLNDPGVRVAWVDNDTVAVGNNYVANVAFHRSAVEVAFRAPAMPAGGDAAVDIMTVQDPFSGLVFEIAAYKGYMKSMFEVRCLYDGKVWKPPHVATLLG